MTLAIKYTNGRHQTITKVTSVAYVMGWLKVGREDTKLLLNVPGDNVVELSLHVNGLRPVTYKSGQPVITTN